MIYKFMKFYKSLEEWHSAVKEGLIHTYDIEVSINQLHERLNSISKKFNVTRKQPLQMEAIPDPYKVNRFIYITIEDCSELSNKTLNDLKRVFNLIGWFPALVEVFDKEEKLINFETKDQTFAWLNKNVNYSEMIDLNSCKVYIRLESNFDQNFIEYYNDLYHTTRTEHVKHILKNGLTPNNGGRLSDHISRIYFTWVEKSLIKLTDDFQKLDIERYQEFLNRHPHSKDKWKPSFEYTVLKIKNDGTFHLYEDPNFSLGCYTMENINPKLITIVGTVPPPSKARLFL